jgi:signal transduction histidine kinase
MNSTEAKSTQISLEPTSESASASKLAESITPTNGTHNGAFLEGVLEDIPLGIIAVDSSDQIALVNNAALTLLDADRSDVIGRPLDQIAACMQPLQETEISERLVGLVPESTGKICEMSGQLVHVCETTSETDEISDLSRLLILRDVTSLVSSKERLERLQQQLDDLEKEVTLLRKVDYLKSRFISEMSHDLRNPLNSIIGFSSVILKGIDGPITELQREDLTKINSSGKLLLTMLSDILDVSGLWSGKTELRFSPVSIAELIQNSIEDAAQMVEGKDLSLEKAIDPTLPVVHADKARVEQVLSHYVRNAVKYTDEGQITISASVDGGHVIVSVADTGIGIPSEHIDGVFEEFYRVDDPAAAKLRGLGLGLSISRRLVEMHGGKVWAESETGTGSTFYFSIPVDARVKSLT